MTNVPSRVSNEPETGLPSVDKVAGEFEGFELPERVNDTPEGVIMTPLMIGTAVAEVWIPAEEKTVEPADSDM
jgi:hypothetical protein